MATSRPYAFNSGDTISETIQIGDIAIATSNTNLQSTGLEWFNGPDEDLGYVVCTPNPNIVTKGLVLNLDAGNVNSYPGSGTIWYDLSGNNNSFILNSGIVYTSDGLFFNGTTSAYITLGLNFTPSTYTKSIWIKTSNSSPANFISGSSGEVFYASGGVIYLSNTWSTPSVTYAVNFYNNTWHNIVGTFDGVIGVLYMDGIYLNSGTLNVLPSRITYIGSYAGANNLASTTLDSVKIYNKALSATEVLKNFNATKFKYGL